MSTYTTIGVTEFVCPVLYELQRGISWSKLHPIKDNAERERITIATKGHMTWNFHWWPGDNHIEHPSNGVPTCWCGERLVMLAGDDPGHDLTPEEKRRIKR